jgi:8-oxo-dGTP diphosphatase
MKKVTAALLVKDDNILIAQRSSTDKLAGKWEFAGGKIELGETPEECLVREIQEEFQIEIKVGNYFGDSIYHYKQGSIQLLAYWCERISGELKPTVHDDYKWVSFKDLRKFDFAPADIPFVEKLSVIV